LPPGLNDLYCVEWGVKLYSLTHCSVSSSRSSVCLHHPTVYLTVCSEHGHLTRIPSHCLPILTHSHTFYCRIPRFFALLLLCGDIELNPGPDNFTICTLNICSILHSVHFAALSDLIDSHQPDLFSLTETWIKHDTTPVELINCTPFSYSLLIFPRNFSANRDIILLLPALPSLSVNLLHNSPAPLLNSILSRHHLLLSS